MTRELQEKLESYQRVWAEVDLDAIWENMVHMKENIAEKTKILAVIKTDGYGHGGVPIAKMLEQLDFMFGYAAATYEEAHVLREAGVKKPILILGYTFPYCYEELIREEIRPAVYRRDTVEELVAAAAKVGQKAKVHIKVDTGMGRIGITPDEEGLEFVRFLIEHPELEVEGIFTHFATADEADDSKFKRQLAFFTNLVENLADRPRLVHASNSATSIWHAETVFNAVRLGVVIYGLNPSGSALNLPYKIRPALSLETALVHVKTLPAGQDVGYGATYTTTTDEVIGTIPIGYADGWTRDLQGFHVIVDGQFCPIVGRVSMDQITVRLPKVYPLGTPVTLMGENGGASITATEVAEKRGTINYEVLCLLSDRVPRSYE